jgi:hypothetical protein
MPYTIVDELLTVLTVNIFLCYAEFCKKAPFVLMLGCGNEKKWGMGMRNRGVVGLESKILACIFHIEG